MLKRLLPVSAVLALLLAGGSLAYAWASIPDANGVIHGCRKTTDGSLKVIDTAAKTGCPRGYRALNWNQTGPAGTAGWEVVHSNIPAALTDAGYWFAQVGVNCPTGKVAVGGGYTYDSSGQPNPVEAKVSENGLRDFSYGPGALPTAWQTSIEARVSGTLQVTVMCAIP
jgi:hypothetical protein